MSPKSTTREEPKAKKAQKKNESKPKEEFFWVTFHDKSSSNDTRDVTLIVNGEVLTIQRGEKIIIPGRYKEAAEHATYENFTQLPGKDRKVSGKVNVYPFSEHGTATEKEYKDLLEAGNKLQREKKTD